MNMFERFVCFSMLSDGEKLELIITNESVYKVFMDLSRNEKRLKRH
jgi:hypothetical protein